MFPSWFSKMVDCHFIKMAMRRIIDEVFGELKKVVGRVRKPTLILLNSRLIRT